MNKLFMLLMLLLPPMAALAQGHGAAVSPEMQKLDFMVGEWQGEGFMEFGPGERRSSKVKEVIQRKAGGHVLMIEGLGKAGIPGKNEERVVHDAFAMMWYDNESKQFRMQAFTAAGGPVNPSITVGDKTLVWGFRNPQAGEIRFTIKLDEAGRWNEVGEMSRDGATWRKFFEMTLRRVGAAGGSERNSIK